MNFKYIDLSLLEPLYEGRPERLKEIAGKYTENANNLFKELETAIGEDDIKKQQKAAHSLKSALRFLGLEKTALLAMEMEQSAGEGPEILIRKYKKMHDLWLPAKAEAEAYCTS